MQQNERDGKSSASEADCPKASVCCSAVLGSRFVRFVEAGASTFEEEDEELTGIFVKVAGCHSARHFLAAGAENWGDALASLRLWVDSVPRGELVLLAIVGLP